MSCLHLKEKKLKTPSSLKSPIAHSIFLVMARGEHVQCWIKNLEKQGLLKKRRRQFAILTLITSTFQNFYDLKSAPKNLEKWPLFSLDKEKENY